MNVREVPLRAQRLKNFKVSLWHYNFQARMIILSEPPTKMFLSEKKKKTRKKHSLHDVCGLRYALSPGSQEIRQQYCQCWKSEQASCLLIFPPASLGPGNGCANLMGAWHFCSFCRKTSMPITCLVLGSGALGSANLFLWTQREFLRKGLARRKVLLNGHQDALGWAGLRRGNFKVKDLEKARRTGECLGEEGCVVEECMILLAGEVRGERSAI